MIDCKEGISQLVEPAGAHSTCAKRFRSFMKKSIVVIITGNKKVGTNNFETIIQ